MTADVKNKQKKIRVERCEREAVKEMLFKDQPLTWFEKKTDSFKSMLCVCVRET